MQRTGNIAGLSKATPPAERRMRTVRRCRIAPRTGGLLRLPEPRAPTQELYQLRISLRIGAVRAQVAASLLESKRRANNDLLDSR